MRYMRLSLLSVATFLSFFIISHAHAQKSPAVKTPATKPVEPMVFSIVRNDENGCEPTCAEWISAQGEIVKGSYAGLEKTIRSLKGKKLPILIHSTGGVVDEGLRMGKLIRDKGFDVVVAQTHPKFECEKNDVVCAKTLRELKGPRPSSFTFNRSLCASSCTFVLAGGVRRVATMGANIGVHQMTYTITNRVVYRRYFIERKRVNGRIVEVSRKLISERLVSQKTVKQKSAPEAINRRIEAHFKTMGIDPAFFVLTMATPADDIRYLSQVEKETQRVSTHVIGEVLSVMPSSMRKTIVMPMVTPPTKISAVTPPAVVAPASSLPMLKKDAAPFMGYILLDGQSAEIRFEEESTHDYVRTSFRLLERGKPVPTAGLKITFDMQNGLNLVAFPTDAVSVAELAASRVERAKLCGVNAASQITVSLQEKDKEGLKWIRTAPAFELLPMTGIKAALCSWRPAPTSR